MGIDISPDMVKITKEKKPNLDIRKLDLLEESIEEEFDIVLACGIFNLKLTKSDNYEYIHKMLERMFKIAKIGISVDFLSILADYQAEEAFHPEFADILSIASKISKRFSMFHNYSPYEFSLILYKNQNIQNDLAFQK